MSEDSDLKYVMNAAHSIVKDRSLLVGNASGERGVGAGIPRHTIADACGVARVSVEGE